MTFAALPTGVRPPTDSGFDRMAWHGGLRSNQAGMTSAADPA